MTHSLIDRLTTFLAKNKTPVGVLAAIWFWAGVAVYANFIDLPNVPPIVRHAFFWAGVAANALWWGYLNPKVDRKIADREADVPSRRPPD